METKENIKDYDPTAAERKKDHIELAFKSQNAADDIDERFYYEPILSGHPDDDIVPKVDLLGKTFDFPMWVSSMTGGTEYAGIINKNLALACAKYNLGMGLGSCRSLLCNDDNLSDFAVRKHIGDRPLYANLGIAQLELMVNEGHLDVISTLIKKLEADGLIIHINPLQEWTQPEGDRYYRSPLDVIKILIDKLDTKLIVKEVGQGMGYNSLRELFLLPIEAVDFAANGGTNFSKLELLRGSQKRLDSMGPIVRVGHSAEEMVEMTNEIQKELGDKMVCKQVIVSGGIKNFLDGYYLLEKLNISAVYGQASGFLKHARGSFEELDEYVAAQIDGLRVAHAFLRIKDR